MNLIFIGNKNDDTALNFVVERLPHAEYCGDWHDKPARWIAKCVAAGKEILLTQKFVTRKNAEQWARIVRKHGGDFRAASNAYAALP